MSNGTPTISTLAPPPKPPTEAEVIKAGAEVDAARMASPKLRFEAMLADLEAAIEERVAEHAGSPTEATQREATEAALDEQCVLEAAEKCFLEHESAEMIGHALQAVVDAEDEEARVRRLAAAMIARAERRASRVSRALLPIVHSWCDQHPPSKGKTWRFGASTECKIVSKKHDGKLEVVNPDRAAESVRAALGAAAYDVLRVSTTVLVGEARKALAAAKVDPATLAGCRWIAPGERKETHRASS